MNRKNAVKRWMSLFFVMALVLSSVDFNAIAYATMPESEISSGDVEIISETNTDDIEIVSETNADDIEINAESVINDEDIVETIDETETFETETDVETETDSEAKEESVDSVAAEDISWLKDKDFSAKRLIVIAGDIEDPNIIANYGNVYLMEYESVEQTKIAYVKFAESGLTVEPDRVFKSANLLEDLFGTDLIESDKEDETKPTLEEGNPINVAAELEANADVIKKPEKVIALIDTGVSASKNVIDRVSLLGDDLVAGSHGDKMLGFITSMNPKARVLSIRAMDEYGKGTTSSVVAAMEYAISQNVGIINLSLYGKTNELTAVLKYEIEKAVNAGIMVVGSAGNDSANVIDYMPGSVESAYILGACDEKGNRLASSNYGSTVDYNVVAKSTSEAAALFTGYVSANGIDAVKDVVNQDMIFATDYDASGSKDDETKNPDDPTYSGKEYDVFIASQNACSLTINDSDKNTVAASGSTVEVKMTIGDDDLAHSIHVVSEKEEVLDVKLVERTDDHHSVWSFVMPDAAVAVSGVAQELLRDSDEFNAAADFTVVTSDTTRLQEQDEAGYNISTGYFEISGSSGTIPAICTQHYNYAPPVGSSYNAYDVFTSNNKKNELMRKIMWYGYLGPGRYTYPAGTTLVKHAMNGGTYTVNVGGQQATWAATALALSVAYSAKDSYFGYGQAFIDVINGLPAAPEGFEVYLIKETSGKTYYVNSTAYGEAMAPCQILAYAEYHPTPELAVQKSPASGYNGIYNNSNPANGLLSAYSNLTTTFEIWTVSGSNLVTKLGSFTTNSSGYASKASNAQLAAICNQMTIGTQYALKEITPPTNYLNDHGTDATAVRFTATADSSQATVTITDRPARTPVKIKKASSNPSVTNGNSAYSLAGATYELRSGSTVVATFVVDANGDSAAQEVSTGTYTLVETKAGTGYKLAPNQTVTINPQVSTLTINVTDEPILTPVKIKKASADPSITDGQSAYSLAGTTYELRKGSTVVATFVLDANGDCAAKEVAAGTYTLVETKAGQGYKLSPDQTVTVVPQTSTQTFNVTDEPVLTPVKIKKASTNPAMTDGNRCYSFAGTTYELRNGSTVVATFVLDENGECEAKEVRTGTYTLVETKAGKGYLLSDPQTVTVNLQTETQTFNVTDEPGNDPMVIGMNKLWDGPETGTVASLAGTQFTIKYFDNYDKDISGTPTRTWIIELKKVGNTYMAMLDDKYLVNGSDPLYKDDIGEVILPFGTYSIQETKAAPNYTLEGVLKDKDGNVVGKTNEPYVTVVAEGSDGVISLVGGNEFTGYNKSVPLSITVKKLDNNNQPLAGVTFKLESESGEAEKQPGWTSELTTGADGTIKWENLYPDNYTITEIKTVPGATLLAEPIHVSLPGRMTKEEATKHNLDTNSENVVWDEYEQVYYINAPVYEVTNNANFVIPMTGGFMTPMRFFPLLGGLMLVAFGMFVVMPRKRKRA